MKLFIFFVLVVLDNNNNNKIYNIINRIVNVYVMIILIDKMAVGILFGHNEKLEHTIFRCDITVTLL